MSIDDFFNKLDLAILKADEEKGTSHYKTRDNKMLLEEVVYRLLPALAQYKTRLEKRWVTVELTALPSSLAFTLWRPDGYYRNVTLNGATTDCQLQVMSTVCDKSGVGKSTNNGHLYDRNTWKDSYMIDAVETAIKKFLTASPENDLMV